MQQDMGRENPCQPCPDFEPLLALLAADELGQAEQAAVAGHLAHCPRCSATLKRDKEVLAFLADSRTEPDAALLADCRAGLEDILDRKEERGSLRRLIAALVPTGWLAPRAAWTAALLLMLGFSVGILAPRMLRHPVVTESSNAAPRETASDTVPADSSASPFDLHSAQVAGINVFPADDNQPPRVELQLKSQQPFKVQGTVDNEDVKSLLINVLRNNDRFDADVRLDAVDLLRARNNDSDVRSALCHAVHTDDNAAVRLKALEALNGAEPQDLIRQTLLDALVDDKNPGVRVEAINALRGMAAKGQVAPDAHMLAVLRERMHKDPNTYIRIQSAAAIRDLGPREKF
ncbi:MAG: HEAT repeat domain-containing protein [Candidatus Acidiferrales bacterium]